MVTTNIPWDIVRTQLIVTIELGLALLLAHQMLHLVGDFRHWVEKQLWLGPNPEKSFGDGGNTFEAFVTSVAQILGWRRKPYRRHFDILTPLIADPTCRWTEQVLDRFGTRANDAQKMALLVHGMIILTGLVIVEIASLGAVTGAGYAAYVTLGATIDLTHAYQYTVAFLLLVTFSCLWTANRRFTE